MIPGCSLKITKYDCLSKTIDHSSPHPSLVTARPIPPSFRLNIVLDHYASAIYETKTRNDVIEGENDAYVFRSREQRYFMAVKDIITNL